MSARIYTPPFLGGIRGWREIAGPSIQPSKEEARGPAAILTMAGGRQSPRDSRRAGRGRRTRGGRRAVFPRAGRLRTRSTLGSRIRGAPPPEIRRIPARKTTPGNRDGSIGPGGAPRARGTGG